MTRMLTCAAVRRTRLLPSLESFGEKMKTAAAQFLLLLFAGCVSPVHLKRDDSQIVIEMARKIALREPGLSESEKSEIQDTEPKLSYYFIARPEAQYLIRWSLSSNREMTVSGTGDIFTLTGSKTSLTQE